MGKVTRKGRPLAARRQSALRPGEAAHGAMFGAPLRSVPGNAIHSPEQLWSRLLT